MAAAFDRDALLDAFDQIGRAAVKAGTKLQIAVYGGSALMLASNFRFATEDVDVSQLEHPLPDWLAAVVHEIAEKNRWQDDWFNDGVAFHLSSLADHAIDHLEFGTFPRDGTPPGLAVSVPSAEYLLALEAQSCADPGPAPRRNRAARYSQSDASCRHLDGRGRNSVAWKIFSGKCRFSREAAISIEEHEPSREGSMRPNTLADAVAQH